MVTTEKIKNLQNNIYRDKFNAFRVHEIVITEFDYWSVLTALKLTLRFLKLLPLGDK